ncbi:unnamed protein product [Amoebophrya sp. A25]|nr:unnamed protein product [Amoebophrya sp. A25]|eukprot:GSA25T00011015001.1
MRFVVEGCAHGELDQIFDTIVELERHSGEPIDALLCCGDFQSVRNAEDLSNLAWADFEKYWRGEKKAPVLTIFVGGNHEASNFLLDLYYGGWVCENIYYLGIAGCIDLVAERGPGPDFIDSTGARLGKREVVRLAGMSGIYNHRNSLIGMYERMAVTRDIDTGEAKVRLTEDSMRSAYHVRQFECDKMAMLGEILREEPGEPVAGSSEQKAAGVFEQHQPATSSRPSKGRRRKGVDVFLSHDWPRGIWEGGDLEGLLRRKDRTGVMRRDIGSGVFANPLTRPVLDAVQPRFWFAAHHHVKFASLMKHESGGITRFLSLDKCLPGREFLQVLEICNEDDHDEDEGNEEADSHAMKVEQQNDHADFNGNYEPRPPAAAENYMEDGGTTSTNHLESVVVSRRPDFARSATAKSSAPPPGVFYGSTDPRVCEPVGDEKAFLARKRAQGRIILRHVPEWLAVQRENFAKTDRDPRAKPAPTLDRPTRDDIAAFHKRVREPRQHQHTSTSMMKNTTSTNRAATTSLSTSSSSASSSASVTTMKGAILFDAANAQNLNYGNIQRQEVSRLLGVSDIWNPLVAPKKLSLGDEVLEGHVEENGKNERLARDEGDEVTNEPDRRAGREVREEDDDETSSGVLLSTRRDKRHLLADNHEVEAPFQNIEKNGKKFTHEDEGEIELDDLEDEDDVEPEADLVDADEEKDPGEPVAKHAKIVV